MGIPGSQMLRGGRKTAMKGLNVHNLGVDVSSLDPIPVTFDERLRPNWSPSSATPTTPQAPTSPFVDALWMKLDDRQKESTLYLNDQLVQASWILLRRRAICLFRARSLSMLSRAKRKTRLMAEVVARKELEIERMMRNESSEELSSDESSPSSRRAPPRRMSFSAMLPPPAMSISSSHHSETQEIKQQPTRGNNRLETTGRRAKAHKRRKRAAALTA